MNKEQCTVKELKNLLDELSDSGYGDMLIFLGEKTPLLDDSVCVKYGPNAGLYFKNTYYEDELVKNADELKNAIDIAIKMYLANCYFSGKNVKSSEEDKKND